MSEITNNTSSPLAPPKAKQFLIDKLLSNTTTTTAMTTNIQSVLLSNGGGGNHGGLDSSIITADDDHEHNFRFTTSTRSKRRDQNNNNPNDSDNDDDLVSETGTYTIDEDKKTTAHSANHTNQEPIVADIVSARAAIDETFGIIAIKRPEIDAPEQDPASEAVKQAKARMSRQRNKTYSLTKDLFLQNGGELPPTTKTANLNTNNNHSNNLSFSASSSSSISSYSNDSKLKKTTTYHVISDSSTEKLNELIEASDTRLPSSRTVNTDVLLGDTDQLIEELKKKKRGGTGGKTLNLSITNNEQSSSNSSSSTNLSNEAAAAALAKSSQTWTIPSADINSSLNEAALSTRATVDYDPDSSILSNGQHRGGMAFDIPAAGDLEAINGTNVCLSAAALQKLSSINGPVRSASVAAYRSRIDRLNRTNNEQVQSELTTDSTYLDSNRSSDTNVTNVTLMRKFEQRRQILDNNSINAGSSINSSVLTSPKSGVSLGARIQAKAKENSNDNESVVSATSSRRSSEIIPTPATTTTTPTPGYTNRTLYLRQQSAKAKRDSLERRSEANTRNQQNKTVNSHKSVSSSSRTPLASAKRSSSKAAFNNNSRNTSRTSSPQSIYANHTQNIMSMSMIVPNKTPVINSARPVSSRQLPAGSKSGSNDRINDLADSYESAIESGKESNRTSFLRKSMTSSMYSRPPGSSSPRATQLSSVNTTQKQTSSPLTRTYSLREKRTAPPVQTAYSIRKQPPTAAQPMGKSTLGRLSINTTMLKADNDDYQVRNYENELLESVSTFSGSSSSRVAGPNSSSSFATLQRLCIRLIQMSTGVLDKIGDNSTQQSVATPLIHSSSELERMQQLAKLVHSMQLVHDHIQVIDSTLSNQIADDTYIKELTKIRQEVDLLKQTAGLGSPRGPK